MKKLICILLMLFVLVGTAGAAYVTDEAGILDSYDLETLEEKAQTVSETHGVGVYVLTVDDMQAYGFTDVFEAAMYFYTEMEMSEDGLLLLLSMADRDYSLITHGDFGHYAFNDAGREAMTAFFLDDFANDSWYWGFSDYISWADDYLTAAESGAPYTAENLPVDPMDAVVDIIVDVGFAVVAGLVVAGIVVLILNAGMHSLAPVPHAANYKVGGLTLHKSLDNYTHTTVTRVKRETSSSSGSGSSSGSRSSSSGGFSGTSGKF